MTKTYVQIVKEIESLSQEAEKLRRKEVEDVIARIKEAIRIYGLTAADLGLGGRSGPVTRSSAKSRRLGGSKARAQVKYRDQAGNTWGGRGPRPRWLRDALAAGKELQDFAV